MTTLSDENQGRPPRQRPTMRDVAALAGVGIKTVSRVINDEPGVTPATAERVHAAARALSFRPDLTAGTLRRSDRRSRSLGLILASVDNPFCAAVHRAVEDVAALRGVAVFSASIDEDPERERDLVAAFTSRRVDGLIMTAASTDHSYLRNEQESGTPIILVDRPPQGLEVDSVVVDNAEGARQATAHLIRHGHRRIAYLGDLSRIATARLRHAGFLAAALEAGIPTDQLRAIDDLHSEDAAEAAALRLLDGPEPPTALFASQNLVTIGTIRALRARGVQHTVALVGFDDFELADLLEPAVTVIAQDPARMGALAAEQVFARIDGGHLPVCRTVVPTRLIERGSGEIRPPATDWTP
ncbi:LacI family DNA-binding transcriptional regulator [Cellulomonas sp. KRMCY2]|uniref:LacI family DNA-binding transcriptional regulator n=1 Tax=Cellulomonas sp. KRMCY2 TaxID=1304865 RepID=UPI001E5D75F6|nr:LacI family DNA-binding transcriptional regulator [Cellulomonas sp. KRMCY2]